MEKTKQFKTYLVATVIGLAATVGLFAYEGAVTNNVDAKADENKDLIVNNKTYTVKNNWTNIDIYSCGTSVDSSITITSVIGNKEKSDPFTWISSIELHSASK